MRDYPSEVQVRTSRSGGKGGQNVNKVETKVELVWHPATSMLLDEAEKALLLTKLADKLDNDGYLHVVCQVKRTQLENKELAFKKLEMWVEKALHVAIIRKKTSIPKAVKNAIRRDKIHQSERIANRKIRDE